MVLGPVPSVGRLQLAPVVSLSTSFGPVDLLLERGRIDHRDLSEGSALIEVAGTAVPVASAAAVLALRIRFKEPVLRG